MLDQLRADLRRMIETGQSPDGLGYTSTSAGYIALTSKVTELLDALDQFAPGVRVQHKYDNRTGTVTSELAIEQVPIHWDGYLPDQTIWVSTANLLEIEKEEN
jgi:hypothetical protein